MVPAFALDRALAGSTGGGYGAVHVEIAGRGQESDNEPEIPEGHEFDCVAY